MNYLNKIRIENPLTICYTNDVVKKFYSEWFIKYWCEPCHE